MHIFFVHKYYRELNVRNYDRILRVKRGMGLKLILSIGHYNKIQHKVNL